MNYKHQHSPTFEKELKALSKKYKSLREDIEKLKKEIEENPLLGTSLGGGYKKIRLNITSKNQGKSGGARVITKTSEKRKEEYSKKTPDQEKTYKITPPLYKSFALLK